MRWLNRIPCALACAVALSACGENPVDPPAAEAARIELSVASDTLVYGDELQLEATVYDANDEVIPDAAVSWSSTDPSVVSVSDGGLVSAVHVGAARIEAAAGSASAGADLVVDAVRLDLSPTVASAPAYRIVTIAVPAGVVTADLEPTGTIGGHEIGLVVVNTETLAFMLPALEPGEYDATVQLDANHVGGFRIGIEAAPVVEDPVAVVEPVIERAEAMLDALTTEIGDDADPNLVQARALIDRFRADFDAASAEEQNAIAQLMEANPALLALFEDGASSASLALAPGGPVSSHTKLHAATQYVAIVAGTILAAEVFTVAVGACAASAGLFVPGCAYAVLAGGVLTAAFVEMFETAQELVDAPFVYEQAASVSLAPSALDLPDGVLASAAAAEGVLTLDAGQSHAITVAGQFRSIVPSDAEGTGVLAEIAGAFTDARELWQEAASVIDHLADLVSMDLGLTGEPPELPAEPVRETLEIPASQLSLAGVSNSVVSCTGDNTGSRFELTCTTEEAADQEFEARLQYTSELTTDTITVGATLRIPTVELSAEDMEFTVESGGSFSGEISATGAVRFEISSEPFVGTVTLDEATGAFTYQAPVVQFVRGDDFKVTVTGAGETAEVHIDVLIEHDCTLAGDFYRCYYDAEKTRLSREASSYRPGAYEVTLYADSEEELPVEWAEFTMAEDFSDIEDYRWERKEFEFIDGLNELTKRAADDIWFISAENEDRRVLFYQTWSYHADGTNDIRDTWECHLDPVTGAFIEGTYEHLDYDDLAGSTETDLAGIDECNTDGATTVGTIELEELVLFQRDYENR